MAALLGYARRYAWQVALALVALIGASTSLLAAPRLVGRVVDRFSAGNYELGIFGWSLVLLVGIFAACTALRAYLVTWIGERVVADLRQRVYRHVLALPQPFFELRPAGELLARVSNDITALQVVISIVLVIGVRSVVQLCGALVLMVLADWRLSLAALAAAPLIAGLARLLGRRVRARALANRDREADIAAELEESINAMETIKALTMEADVAVRFAAKAEAAFASAERLVRARAEILLAVAAVLLGLFIATGALALQALVRGDLSTGRLAEFGLYASVVGFAILGLADIHGELRKALGATERLFALLEEPTESGAAPRAGLPPGRGALGFARVSFSYPSRPQHRVLEQFSLDVRAGEMLAITGSSGSGKTTLFRLALGLYAPQGGSVTLEGRDSASLDPAALRRAIAVVPQEPVLFSGSAMDNLRAGRPEASEAEAIAAARLAQADEFLRALPQGYDTPLGHKGHALSAGQRQRLAIARAVLRDPRLVLLDEPSSFLDVENEARLQETLVPFLRQRTTLVISHRPGLVRHADRAMVLERGRIVAEGSHAELMDTSDFYSSLMAQ